MTPEEKKEIWDAGFTSGKEHSTMSPETREVIDGVKLTMNEFKTDVLLKLKEIEISSKGAHEESQKTNGKLAKQEARIRKLEDRSILDEQWQNTVMTYIKDTKTSSKNKISWWLEVVRAIVIAVLIGSGTILFNLFIHFV